jgi:predicted nucleic acid-binding protein
MIDTQVLSYALVTEPPNDDRMRRMQRDCGALINEMAELRVSALVVLELLRTPPQIVAKVRSSGILDFAPGRSAR